MFCCICPPHPPQHTLPARVYCSGFQIQSLNKKKLSQEQLMKNCEWLDVLYFFLTFASLRLVARNSLFYENLFVDSSNGNGFRYPRGHSSHCITYTPPINILKQFNKYESRNILYLLYRKYSKIRNKFYYFVYSVCVSPSPHQVFKSLDFYFILSEA